MISGESLRVALQESRTKIIVGVNDFCLYPVL